MNKMKVIKACQFLYKMSEAGIMVCGICMTLILSLLSIPRLYGSTASVQVDFTATISGWYPYLWITIFAIYAIGSLITIGKSITAKSRKNLAEME